MATLLLTRVWVNLCSTGAGVSGLSSPTKEESYSQPGEVRTYAGGRRRAIAVAGEVGTYKVQMMMLARTDVETLRGWVGQTVQVRDWRGRRFFGVYYSVDITEPLGRERLGESSSWHVAFALNIVTYTEAV